jgi:hypothetical protein
MKCQHPGCQCADASIERNGRQYCSEECAEQHSGGPGEPTASSGRSCECGHAGCSGAA